MKIQAMTKAQFNNWAITQKRDIMLLAGAVHYACNCVAEHGDKATLNRILRLPRMVFKNGNLRQDGIAVRDYCRDLLKGWIVWNADRSQFDMADKRLINQPIDWAETVSFADYILTQSANEKGKGKGKDSGITSKALLSAIGKIVADGFGKVDVSELDKINALIPDLQKRITAAHESAQTANEGKAESVTDGTTGEASREAAHGGPEKAMARKPTRRAVRATRAPYDEADNATAPNAPSIAPNGTAIAEAYRAAQAA